MFEECKKQLNNLLKEERIIKKKLENIQKTKMECIRILLDDEYAKRKGNENEFKCNRH